MEAAIPSEAWIPTLLVVAALATVAVAIGAYAVIKVAQILAAKPAAAPSLAPVTTTEGFEDRARKALDAVPDWVVLLEDGLIVDSNAPANSAFGASATDCIGKKLIDVYPESGGILNDHLHRAKQSTRPLMFEFLYAEGARYAESRVYPLGPGCILVVTRDMTEQKSKEEVLHRSKERFALAVQGANDGLWDWDRQTDEIYFSYQWKTIVGYDAGEETKSLQHWFDRVHPEDLPGLQAALDSHIAGEAARFESEHRIRGADGGWLWVLARGMAVRDATGQASRMAGSMTDLTNRRVVAVTQEKANLLEHATESVGIGIAVLNSEGNLESAGDQLRAMTSEWKDLEEWWWDLSREYPPPDPVECPVCGNPHHIGTVMAEVYRPNTGSFPIGDSVELMTRVFEVAWAGHAHEIGAADSHVLLVKDATDRIRAERRLFRANEELVLARDQALAASRSKSAFLANMSHELRTPLNHIIGYAEMVAEELEDLGQDDLARDLGKVRLSGSNLLDLISGILDMSRIEAGLAGLELKEYPLTRVVDGVLDHWTAEALRRSTHIERDYAEDLGDMLGAEEQLRRVLDALISNAVKFTQDGLITVTIEEHFRGPRGWLAISVKDTGVGMAPEVVRNLFATDFGMADTSSTRTHGGAGLGLTLARRFTDMMGGSIDVSSKPGEGSTFRVTVPREVREEDDETHEDEITAELPTMRVTPPS